MNLLILSVAHLIILFQVRKIIFQFSLLKQRILMIMTLTDVISLVTKNNSIVINRLLIILFLQTIWTFTYMKMENL